MVTAYNPPPTYADVILQEGDRAVFNPIWLKWFLDLSSQLRAFAGGATPVVTDTVSVLVPDSVATLAYTFSPGVSRMYLVSVSAQSAVDIADFSAFAIVMTAGTTAGATWVNNGAKQRVTLDGMDLKVTQTSGSDLLTFISVTQIG